MPKLKKEDSPKQKRLKELSARIGEPENIFDDEAVQAKKEEDTKKEELAARTAEGSAPEGEEAPAEVKVKKAPKVHGKKHVNAKSLVAKNTKYPLDEAIALLKKASYSSFPGTVELHITLSDKEQRGTLALPHGTGKNIKVFAFVSEAKVKEAKDAGAEQAGSQDLVALIKEGKFVPGKDFNAVVAEPAMMPIIAPLAKVLGPKGLMPNPKNSTVGANVAGMVTSLKKGQVNFKAETANPYLVHLPIGKVSYDATQLSENYQVIVQHFGLNKIKKAFLSATMAPSIEIKLG
ncbi:MAG: 50S ribosomal protein L1 [bacterium]|nr:50S ribosomal protein L1 [bacterium]